MDCEGEGRDGEDDFDFFDTDEEASTVTESESVHPRQKVFVSEPTSDFEEVFCVNSSDDVFCVGSIETEADSVLKSVAEIEEESTLEIVALVEAAVVALFVADLVAVFVLEFGNPMMKRQMCGSACEHANVVSVLLVG